MYFHDGDVSAYEKTASIVTVFFGGGVRRWSVFNFQHLEISRLMVVKVAANQFSQFICGALESYLIIKTFVTSIAVF